jgi:hypothetical protein
MAVVAGMGWLGFEPSDNAGNKKSNGETLGAAEKPPHPAPKSRMSDAMAALTMTRPDFTEPL